MKNNARKSTGSGQKKKVSSVSGDIQKLKDKSKERDTLFQVRTKRDSAVLKAYITFTYRVYHPGVTARLIFFGILIAAPAIIAQQTWLKALCLIAGALLILLGFFRQNISLALTKNNDPDYKSGVEYTYDFTSADLSVYKGGELVGFTGKYKDVAGSYYDEGFYYIALKNKDLYILPKDRFTIGEQSEFEEFIYAKTKKPCRWIPNNFKDQLKKRRAARQMNAEKMSGSN